MRGETMPEGMRADGFINTILFSQVLHDEEDHLAGESCASAVQEDRISEFRLRSDMQSRAFDILE